MAIIHGAKKIISVCRPGLEWRKLEMKEIWEKKVSQRRHTPSNCTYTAVIYCREDALNVWKYVQSLAIMWRFSSGLPDFKTMSWIDIMSRVCLCFIFLALRNFSCAHVYSEALVFGREDTVIEHFVAVHITHTHTFGHWRPILMKAYTREWRMRSQRCCHGSSSAHGLGVEGIGVRREK